MEFTIGICDDLEEERLALANMIRTYAQKRGKSVRLRLFSSGMELLDSAPEPGGASDSFSGYFYAPSIRN